MQKTMNSKQAGITFIGLILVLAAVACIGLVGIKVTPAYIEFFGVKKIIKKIGEEPNFNEMSKKDIMTMFDKGAGIGYVKVIKGSDLIIENGTVTAEYQVIEPIVANASVLLDFKASTEK
jgi:Domain of unknown function (DUF4845)